MLSVHGLDLHYGDAQALDRVSLEVGAGEIVAIVGANGAGKSSLIRAIFGMERPSSGSIRFEGREIVGYPAARHLRSRSGSCCRGAPDLSEHERCRKP